MISPKEIKIIERLVKKAQQEKAKRNRYERVCFAAIGLKNKIYQIGKNSYFKTHPATPQIKKDVVVPIHAEIDCIDKFIKNYEESKEKLKRATIYIISLSQSSEPNFSVSSFPCESCYRLIQKYKIPRIIYHVNYSNNGFLILEKILKRG